MVTTRREHLIYGISICCIMAYLMELLNIIIAQNEISVTIFLASIKLFPIVFLIAFFIQNLFIGKISNKLAKLLASKKDNAKKYMFYNSFFIVMLMSLIMTIIGGILAGENLASILDSFFITWPRNFCAALFINLIIAIPFSKFLLTKYRNLKLS